MHVNNCRKLFLAFATMLFCALAWTLSAQQKTSPEPKGAEVAVIVNPLNSVDSISLVDLRKIFAGEKQSWSGGIPVSVFVRAPGAHERDVLLERLLRMTESEYKAHWVKQIYSGEAQREPLALNSNGMQLEAVRSDKGGIALISLQDLHPGVKVLKVDGHLPGSSSYPLK